MQYFKNIQLIYTLGISPNWSFWCASRQNFSEQFYNMPNKSAAGKKGNISMHKTSQHG